MTGLDKIIQDITEEAKLNGSRLLAKAEEEAQEIRREAEQSSAQKCTAIKIRSQHEAAAVRERAKSAAALQRRKAILSAKQEMIAQIIEKAKQSTYVLPDTEYFDLVLKMLRKYALPQDGEIIFSSNDKKRLPKNFVMAVNSVMKEKGVSLEISEQTRSIDGGFVLVYGSIEENCSFSALFDARHDALQDKVHELVFSGG